MIKKFMSPKVTSVVCFLIATFFASRELYFTFTPSNNTTQQAIKVAQTDLELNQAETEKEPEDPIRTIKLTVGKGDTFASLMAGVNISRQEIHAITQSMSPHHKPRDLRPGHEIDLTIEKLNNDDSNIIVHEIHMRPALEHEIVVRRQDDAGFACEKCEVKLIQEKRWAEAAIDGSLYESANRHGVPNQVIHNMIRAFSYDIDFQRGLKSGDTFGLMYDVVVDPNTGQSKPGELLYATIMTNGKPYHIYRFEAKDGICGFYNQNGESIRKGLLKTPVDGARITSGFGKRKDPLRGYTAHHKGLDFGCPVGSDVMAAGDGVVEQVGRYGAYGNYVRIRHANGYKTAYAHLSRYAKGMKRGKRVRQGEVIAYSGNTGRSTGPHLHYEVLVANAHINPLSVKLMPAAKLQGKPREDFMQLKKNFDVQYAKLKENTTLAAKDASVGKRG